MMSPTSTEWGSKALDVPLLVRRGNGGFLTDPHYQIITDMQSSSQYPATGWAPQQRSGHGGTARLEASSNEFTTIPSKEIE